MPGAPADRIATLDILRGFALFGMIFIHFHQFFRLSTPETARHWGEQWIGNVAWLGIEQKSWATFAFLFGVGFAVLMRRAEARGQPVVALYLRRLAALAVIALILDLFTGFTVLLDYALWGVPLLFIRKWPTAVLLVIAVISAGAWAIEPLGAGLQRWATLGREGADLAMASRVRAVRRPPPAPPTNYREFVASRVRLLKFRYSNWRGLLPSSTFTLFIIGLLAFRRGILDAPRQHLRLIGSFMVLGVVSWAVFWWGLPYLTVGFAPRDVERMLRTGLGIVNEQWLGFTYIGALVLLLAYRPQWTQRFALLGIAGRMALTNYVLQCIVVFVLSSRFVFGLQLRPYYYTLGAILLFGVTAALSRAWLSRFRYGPLEWLWRSATRLQIPTLRRTSTEAGPA